MDDAASGADGEAGLEVERVDELPPGTYTVDAEGAACPAPGAAPALESVPWDRLDDVLETWCKRGMWERLANLIGLHVLAAGLVAVVTVLAWWRVIGAEATAGFLGAAVGFLLARGDVRGP